MRGRRRVGRFALAAMAACVATTAFAASANAADISVQTLHFDTVVGPDHDKHCDVVGDLYRPDSATRAKPAPAILTTNGFGGSKNSQAALGRAAASRGYVVLSYSGLGFGGSDCHIELDHPDWDGEAGSQLITFLGGGSQAKDGTEVHFVKLDRRAADGRHHRFDPRVGMVGGSYGGQVQFAVASVDPRLDTIVPLITWNDLSYSLVPNTTDFTKGVSSATPGVPKWIWAALFFAIGQVDGLQGLSGDVSRVMGGCPNFERGVCPAFVKNAALNTADKQTLDLLRGASVASYMNKIRIPTFLAQGEGDTLFNLNESVATYDALRKRGVPVRLLWQSWGHSDSSPAPGEYGGDDPIDSFEGGLVRRWFHHYLKRRGPAPPQNFCYFRDWIDYGDEANAGDAYACTGAYPAGSRRRMYLSGDGGLAPTRATAAAGTAGFLAPPEAPTSLTEISAIDQDLPLIDLPGTATAFTSAPLARPLQIAGIPKVRVTIHSALQGVTDVAEAPGHTVVFMKLYDVAPDGEVTLVHRLLAPVRIATTDKPIEVELPGIVHRFDAGHSIQLDIAGSDLAYRGNIAPQLVSIGLDSSHPGVLSLPVVGPGG